MKKLLIITVILTLSFLSCKNSELRNENENISTISKPNSKDSLGKSIVKDTVLLNDTIKRFIVDEYPVTYEMIADQKVEKESTYQKIVGKTLSFDKAWFTDKTRKQTLIFQMYTDGYRSVTYHFLNDEIPKELIDIIEFHTAEGELASKKQIVNDFKGFLLQSIKIDSKYFTTSKGLKLGDTKQRIIEIYGQPHEKTANNGIEKFEWTFVGDLLYDGKEDLKGKPLAKESYGHQAYLYFKNGKLIAQILHNYIP